MLHAGFFFGLISNPEDGGDMFLPDVYTKLYPRRQNYSWPPL
jgi:hypothetical protein